MTGEGTNTGDAETIDITELGEVHVAFTATDHITVEPKLERATHRSRACCGNRASTTLDLITDTRHQRQMAPRTTALNSTLVIKAINWTGTKKRDMKNSRS